MLYYALVFLVIALVAGVLGFGGIAGASAGIAQILFFLFLAFLVISLIIGFIWVMDDAGWRGVWQVEWLAWCAFAMTLYGGLTMVTNVPFYSFKDVNFRKTVPFIVIVAIALGIAIINIHPPVVLFALFLVYGFSGYAVYAYKKMKGRPVSMIATSTDEPDEQGLHR